MKFTTQAVIQRLSKLLLLPAAILLLTVFTAGSLYAGAPAPPPPAPNTEPPSISGNPQTTTNQNAFYSFIPAASDPERNTLTFTVSNLPSWADFDDATGEIYGSPNQIHVGVNRNIIITVSDGTFSNSLQAFNITVIDVNDAPVISGRAFGSVLPDAEYSFIPTASDADGDNLTFSITNQPSWASFNESTGELFGTPNEDDTGTTTNIVIFASDGNMSSSLPPFMVTVIDVNMSAADQAIIKNLALVSSNDALPSNNAALTTNNLALNPMAKMTASASHPSFLPAKANDNNPAYPSMWSNYTKHSADDFLQINLGKPTQIYSVSIVNAVLSVYGMKAFDLLYYDGNDWVTLDRYSTNLVNNQTIRINNVPGITAQWLRITNFELGANRRAVGISEFQVNAPVMTANVSHPSFLPAKANDGNPVYPSMWSNYTQHSADDFLQINLGKPTQVYSVTIVNAVLSVYGMKAFDLLYYDGNSWVTLDRYSTHLTNNETIEIDILGITMQWLRITNFELGTTHRAVGINEFQVNAPNMTASRNHPSYPPVRANDNMTNTWWTNYTQFHSDDWLQLDLGRPVMASTISIVNYVDGNAGIKEFDLEFFDGNSWITHGTYQTKVLHQEEIRIHTPNIRSQKWRVTNFVLADRKNCAAILEFRVNTPVMQANNSHVSYPAKNANDNNAGTIWSDWNIPFYSDDYLMADLGRPGKIVMAEIEYFVDGNSGFTDFELQYFNGCDWVVQGKYTTKLQPHEIISVKINEITAQKWRITNFNRPAGKNASSIYEFRLFGVPDYAGSICTDNPETADTWKVIDYAQADECFYGIGDTRNKWPLPSACDGDLKVNESYVWGMAKFGKNVFFGSGANVMCLAAANYMGVDIPHLREDSFVCELSTNQQFGTDFRPSSLYMYSEDTGHQRLQLPAAAIRLQMATVGIRSAGAHPSGIVFLAGPNIQDGINIFAFNGYTGAFISATIIDLGYSNVRQMLVASDGNMYMGLGGAESSMAMGGAVIKWVPNLAAIAGGDIRTLFNFEFVGSGIDGEVVYLAEHDNRLFVDTWPDRNTAWPHPANNTGGVWMSPQLPLNTTSNANGAWEKLWTASDYDPDPLVASTIGGGAMASFDGWLYWGTMQVPGSAYNKYAILYGEPSDDRDKRTVMENVWREISLFRGRNFGTANKEIELLYGGSTVFDNTPVGHYRVHQNGLNWTDQMNKMNQLPKYGSGGFGNTWNTYTWTMSVYNGDLYIGTMDFSETVMEDEVYVKKYGYNHKSIYGGDLFKIESAAIDANPVSLDGLGNELNYGFRTMLNDGKNMFIGTANPSNLNPNAGGWELIKLNAQE